jgi:argininosuccinate lyase
VKIWDKGYTLDEAVEAFTVGEDYLLDGRLVRYDCLASMAHARTLEKAGILTGGEAEALVAELGHIITLAQEGKFPIAREQEDCHTAIEAHLTARLGEAGRKIHTARSRNDQVLAAMRLYCMDGLERCLEGALGLEEAVKAFAGRHGGVEIPGYTHTRKAMPSSVAMWAGALADSMKENRLLMEAALQLMDQSPLGSGAGYGIPLDIDREFTAREAGFSRVQQNPVYVQLSRGKFESTLLHGLTQVMYDLNRFSCDMIFFSMPEMGLFRLPGRFCTGSSIMPQKKNPDVLELLRAKYHVLLSYEVQVKGMAANLITGYNRDLQLCKEPVMKGLDIAIESLEIMKLIFDGLEVDEEKCRQAMTEELFATDRAYQLVRQGVPFREAYRRIGAQYSGS